MKREGANHLYLCGLATDYCARWTVLDALGAGFRVTVLTDAVRGIELSPGDSLRVMEKIIAAGVREGLTIRMAHPKQKSGVESGRETFPEKRRPEGERTLPRGNKERRLHRCGMKDKEGTPG